MNTTELMKQRHSVRWFTDETIEEETIKELNKEIQLCNEEGNLHIQLITNEPEAFQAGKPSYGQFKGCRNYLALVGPKDKDEQIGYYGERIVLKAYELGLSGCWVALTYKKGKAVFDISEGEKLYLVVALGYGQNKGTEHKIKVISDVSDYKDGDPDWYRNGIEAALLAPTAMNQQKFHFERNGDKVKAKAGLGFYTKIDLGIAKYHFELGSGKGKDIWE